MKKTAIVNPLTTTDGDEALFGPATLPPARANAVREIAIDQITPDWKQPRRTLPANVMAQNWYQMRPAEMLMHWAEMIQKQVGIDMGILSLRQWVTGRDALPELNSGETLGWVMDFFELLSLAASIYRDGLTNPITIAPKADGYVIETGERRYLAHHLLQMTDQGFGQIAAIVVNKPSVWKQASENGSRQPLNAIGLARQIALLVMDLHTSPDAQFEPFEKMVLPGESDQRFYAQVANGNKYPIRSGDLERVMHATGLKSRAQLSQYRALLDLDPELWVKADRENLTEFAIREMTATRSTAKSTPATTLTAVKVSPPAPSVGPRVRYEPDPEYVPEQEPVIEAGTEPGLTLQVNDRVIVDGTRPGVIRYVDARKGTYGVFLDASGSTHHYGPERVAFASRPERDNPSLSGPQPAPKTTLRPEPEPLVLVYPEDDPQLLQLLELAQNMAATMGMAKAAQSFNLLKSLRPEALQHMKRNPVSAETLLRRYELDAQDLVNALADALQGYLDGLRSELRG